jgi:uncharacterized protein YkwD
VAIVTAVIVLFVGAWVAASYFLDQAQEAPAGKPTAKQVARASKDKPTAPSKTKEKTPPSEGEEAPAQQKPAAASEEPKPSSIAISPPKAGAPARAREEKPDAAADEKVSPEEPIALATKMLAKINDQRQRAGVPTVALDEAKCKACTAHARYLVQNASVMKAEGMSPYREDRSLPGYSEAGAKAAETASIDTGEPLAVVERWLAAPAHRHLLLSSRLRGIGLGLQRRGEGWTSVFNLPLGPAPADSPTVMQYPADQETGVPLAFPGNEVPDPIPDAKQRIAGYPITVTFPSNVRIEQAAGQIEEDSGKTLPVWFSSPQQPANKNYPTHQGNTLCLMARSPLEAGRRYWVHVKAQVGGTAWESAWSFVTIGADQTRQELEKRFLTRINEARKAAGLEPLTLDRELSQGCTSHADYLVRNITTHPNLNKNDEQPDLPGYSEGGQQVARTACIRVGGGLDDTVDWLLASFLNRHFVLNPALKTAGLGWALPEAKGGHLWVIHLTTGGPPLAHPQPILYPGANQKNVPCTYPVGEHPSPVPDPTRPAGFAITALVLQPGPIADVQASLTDADGKEVPVWLSTPEKPLVPGSLPSLIGLIPRSPLSPERTYTVSLKASVGNLPWQKQWTFTTRKKPEAQQKELAERVLERVNTVRKKAGLAAVALDEKLSEGCLLHSRYLVTNADHPALKGLGVHNEDPSLPNATPEGAKAARASVIAWSSDPVECVDGWINSLYHRVPLLAPELKRIGFGSLPDRKNSQWFSVLDAGNGRE